MNFSKSIINFMNEHFGNYVEDFGETQDRELGKLRKVTHISF